MQFPLISIDEHMCEYIPNLLVVYDGSVDSFSFYNSNQNQDGIMKCVLSYSPVLSVNLEHNHIIS